MSLVAHVQLTEAAGKGGDKLRLPSFIVVELIGEDKKPIPGEAYEIRLPGGKIVKGNLDDDGMVRLDNIPAGTCQVTFPNLDKEAWVPEEEASDSSAKGEAA